MELKDKKCNLCEKNSFKKIYQKNNYSLWKCNNCSLVFVHPQPTNKELQKAYSYESGYFEGVDFKENELDAKFKKIFDGKKGNFLDVGCGTGRIVYTAKKCGWNAKGIDLNKDAVNIARKKHLDIIYSNIDDFKGKKNYYDVINMGQIIEHVKNPEKTIRKVYTLLKHNGILTISTPNINSFFPKYSFWVSKIFHIPWSHPSPPYHLFEFSDKNFPQFLEREGFKINNLRYHSASLFYWVGNTGLFKDFKKDYKENKSLRKSFFRNNPLNNFLMTITIILYFPGYLISKRLKVKTGMQFELTKR